MNAKPHYIQTPGPVVVGVDGSPGSVQALRWAARQAARAGHRVDVIHVWEYLPPALSTSLGWTFRDWPAEMAAAQRRLVFSLQKAFGDVAHGEGTWTVDGLTVHAELREGSAGPGLCHAAARGASQLVVGARGHSRALGMLLGSVTIRDRPRPLSGDGGPRRRGPGRAGRAPCGLGRADRRWRRRRCRYPRLAPLGRRPSTMGPLPGSDAGAELHPTLTRVFRDSKSGPAGLSSREARRRLLLAGRNELTRHRVRRWPAELARQLGHPLALLLWLAALLAAVSGTTELALAIVAVVLSTPRSRSSRNSRPNGPWRC